MLEIKSKKPASSAGGEKARRGILKTKNGEIETPFFMPDATRGFMRSMSREDLEKISVSPMVVNTYHLFLNPGMEIVKKAGGIHKFMNWNHPLLSDSGGYQVFSLIHKNPKMGRITDNEVIFKSPLDGKKHILTPEDAIRIQFDLGVDMMVVLDDPPPNSDSKRKIENAVRRTIAWAGRCKAEYLRQIKIRKIKKSEEPLIFGVIQGGGFSDLRKFCAEELVKIGFHGYGFGARHIDAEGNLLEDIISETASYIPENSLRFALGVGTPSDIVKFHALGWDMFDCVIPTREGRHGRLFIFNKQTQISNDKFQMTNKIQNLKSKKIPNTKFQTQDTSFYKTINITNGKFKNDFSKIDENCDCELCQNYTRGYLHHLFSHKEPLGMRLASIHNLKFYMDLMKELRG